MGVEVMFLQQPRQPIEWSAQVSDEWHGGCCSVAFRYMVCGVSSQKRKTLRGAK
jgi:hypothetical protein